MTKLKCTFIRLIWLHNIRLCYYNYTDDFGDLFLVEGCLSFEMVVNLDLSAAGLCHRLGCSRIAKLII